MWEKAKQTILLPFAAWLDRRLVGWLQRNSWPGYTVDPMGAGGPGRRPPK